MKFTEDLHEALRTFSDFNRDTVVETRDYGGVGLPVYINEFWTSKQRAGHSLHEISYRACYKPQLPGFFIDYFCRADDAVYDPFMGRGTTLVEAQMKGCRAIGNDANPLSGVLVKARLNPPSLDDIRQRLDTIDFSSFDLIDEDMLVFFAIETLNELYGWRSYFRMRRAEKKFDTIDAWLQMVACNRLTGHSSGFFSVYTLPPNQATSVARQRKINAKRRQSPEYRDTKALIFKKSKGLLRDELPPNYSRDDYKLLCKSADLTNEIPSDSVALVVTSPPFLNVVDYVGDNWMRNWFCELSIDREQIWQSNSLKVWVEQMGRVFVELKRVLRPGGVIAFEVGEIRHGSLCLEDEIVKIGIAAGLRAECVLINSQKFTKTANCWGVSNNSAGTNSNRIVVFKKKLPE